jgi:hypothetical protein
MSKIVKKADLDVLIESTLKKAGIVKVEPKEVVTESKVVVEEPKKEVINEDFKKELEKFNKLTNFKH